MDNNAVTFNADNRKIELLTIYISAAKDYEGRVKFSSHFYQALIIEKSLLSR